MLCPCFGCKHGQDPSPTSDIQHYFVLEEVLVVVHGVPVGERPHFILQHLLVYKNITNDNYKFCQKEVDTASTSEE